MQSMQTRKRGRRLSSAAVLFLSWAWSHAGAADRDLTQLSLEQLLEVEVISASKYPQRIAEAPAAVTVLRAADIRQFGYRTLADILKSVRGFYVSYDRQYSYIGVRGFSPPGDYNTRLLVLVDGYRINDNIYDTGAISGEFPLDVDLIDRVEIVRGPGSSIYGSNALFGVVNVITRSGRDLGGGEAVAAVGSYRDREGRLSWGRRLDSGLEILVSASGLRNDGPSLSFPEFASSGGVTRDTDYERRRQFLAKLDYGAWHFGFMDSRRDKGIPSGAYGTDFNDPGNHIVDAQDSVNLAFSQLMDNGVEATARFYSGNYSYRGNYLYSGVLNRDVSDGSWWGAETRFLAARGAHKLVYGAEYQRNRRQDQQNFDQTPYLSHLDDRRSSWRYGLFLQDDFAFAAGWTLSAGLRFDHTSSIHGGDLSPRLGLIRQNDDGSVLKLLYGSAYRTPNVYERYYAYSGQQVANPDLRCEGIKTLEAVWEGKLGPEVQVVGSLYYYRIRDWIVLQPDALGAGAPYQYANQAPVSAKGVEFEANRQWGNGTRLRASYAAQFAPEHSEDALNQAPRHLFKANLSTALWDPAWRAGLEYQYTSSRATASARVGGYGIANATLLYRSRPDAPELAFSLYNLFDRRYADPNTDPGVPDRDRIAQDGLTWRVKLTLPF